MPDLLPSTHHSPLSTGHWPSVTALCPTYGRFERLRDAVACFLLQDYPGEKHLLVLNDAPVPIALGSAPDCVHVVNHPVRFPTLGHKRQALLEAAGTPLVAHWDDDDLYLPWHLTMCVSALTGRPWPLDVAVESVPLSLCTDHCALPRCAKARAAWWAVGPRERFEVRGPCHNVFEGQMVFERQEALRLGGYPPRVSGQAKALLEAFRRAGKLYTWNPADEDISYVYRWKDGLQHVSARGDNARGHAAFADCNSDFGAGKPLIPRGDPLARARDRLASQFRMLGFGIGPQAVQEPDLAT